MHIEIDLPNEFTAPAKARAVLASLDCKLGDKVLADVLLLTNELVTNSVRHANAPDDEPIGVWAALAPDAVRVEVSDGGPGFEWEGRMPAAGQTYGWGLHLVNRLSSRWGTQRGERWTVWFEIDL